MPTSLPVSRALSRRTNQEAAIWMPVVMATQERFVTFLTPSWWQYHLLAFVAVASMLSILTVYLWRRDLLAIDETRYSAPTYKVVYLRQYVFIFVLTRPQDQREALIERTLWQRSSSLYLQSTYILYLHLFLVVYGPCISSAVI
jgi:formate-dependent nitrite reductase membrane component NrfD